jgi:hypothetical protein
MSDGDPVRYLPAWIHNIDTIVKGGILRAGFANLTEVYQPKLIPQAFSYIMMGMPLYELYNMAAEFAHSQNIPISPETAPGLVALFISSPAIMAMIARAIEGKDSDSPTRISFTPMSELDRALILQYILINRGSIVFPTPLSLLNGSSNP